MHTRKLQQVGGGTFTVSIPKQWATEHALEAGAEVYLYTHTDGSVVVRSAERDGGHFKEIRIDVEADVSKPEPVVRRLHAAQTVGFESVTLAHADAFTDDQRRAVRSAVGGLAGTELVVEREDLLEVRNLLDPTDVSIHQTVSQLAFVARSLHRTATTAVANAEDGTVDRLVDQTNECDRLFEIVARHFHRALTSLAAVDELGCTRPELFDQYETARQLCKVAGAGVRLARVADRLPEPPAEPTATRIVETGNAAACVVDDAVGTVLNGCDVDTADAMLDRRDEILADLDEIDDALMHGDAIGEPEGRYEAEESEPSRLDAVVLARVLDSLTLTADCGGRIAEVAIRAEIREG